MDANEVYSNHQILAQENVTVFSMDQSLHMLHLVINTM